MVIMFLLIKMDVDVANDGDGGDDDVDDVDLGVIINNDVDDEIVVIDDVEDVVNDDKDIVMMTVIKVF